MSELTPCSYLLRFLAFLLLGEANRINVHHHNIFTEQAGGHSDLILPIHTVAQANIISMTQ